MSDRMRWRYGDTNPVVAAAAAEETIEIGDLVYLEQGAARAASTLAAGESLAATQTEFAQRFLGVAMQRSTAGEAAPLRVATTGVFEFDCVPESFELGDWVAPAAGAGGDDLRNQQVAKVASAAAAIGRVARREPTLTARVLVSVFSTVMTGGVPGTTAAVD